MLTRSQALPVGPRLLNPTIQVTYSTYCTVFPHYVTTGSSPISLFSESRVARWSFLELLPLTIHLLVLGNPKPKGFTTCAPGSTILGCPYSLHPAHSSVGSYSLTRDRLISLHFFPASSTRMTSFP